MQKTIQEELIETIVGIIDLRTDIDVWDPKYAQLHVEIVGEVNKAISDLSAADPDELQNIVNVVRRWAHSQDKAANWIWDRGNQEMILHVRDTAMARAISALIKGWDEVTLEPVPEDEEVVDIPKDPSVVVCSVCERPWTLCKCRVNTAPVQVSMSQVQGEVPSEDVV